MGGGGGGKGGHGPKKQHAGRGSRTGAFGEELESKENEIDNSDYAARPDGGDSDEEERKPKAKAPVLEQDDELDKELAAQFDTGGLTRKQRLELEEQEEKRQEEKARKDGTSDEAAADLARLAVLRKQREDAAKRKEEEAAAAKKKDEEAQAASQASKEALKLQEQVAVAIADLVKKSKDQQLTINQLNQDAGCKKVLKPLTKKCNVKNVNKAWMAQFPKVLALSEEGGVLTIRAAA